MKLVAALVVLGAVLAVVAAHDIEKRQTRKLRPRAQNLKRRKPAAGLARSSDPTPPGKRIVCYYTNWSVYRKGMAKFQPQNINPYLCTHLVYAFGGLTDEFEMTVFDSYEDIEKGGYAKFNAIKQYNKELRTMLAIGGWVEGSARFSELVSFPELRTHFINSAIKHLRRHNFDGLDLDWEYPASRSGSLPEDRENYALLVQELRLAFEDEATKSNRGRLILTMAVPAGKIYIDKGYDVPSLNANLDFFNILNYDYHTSLDPVVRNHAALLPLPGTSEHEDAYQLNVDWTVRYYMQLGADARKLVVGIPTYGRSFQLADGTFNDIGSSAIGPGEAGNYTREKGFYAFYEVCEAMSISGWQAKKPYPRSVGPYAFNGDQWVGYDDEGTVATKAEYVRDTGLGGIMFWSIDTDDFRGICNGKPFPLVESGKAALLSDPPVDINSLDRRKPAAAATLPTTPVPPTTPSPLAVFDCRREGRYPNPDNCHQYFWCLAGAAGQGIVAHTFTCPAGLIFSKSIDNCAHASQAKCNEKKNRGGAAIKEIGPSIPTTTPFPEFDYDYYYYYDDEEYVDTPQPAKPAVETTAVQVTRKPPSERIPSRNSGGSQFSQAEQAVRTSESQGQKNKPQYTSITRDRTSVVSAQDVATEDVSPVSNGRRPQYTSITRDRPVTEEPLPDYEEGLSPGNRLNYVTIERNRPVTPDTVAVESARSEGLQYVTLRRSDNIGTESPEEVVPDDLHNIIAVDSNSFRSRPETPATTTEVVSTTAPTTTTTTTPRPARLVVPQILLEPVTPKIINRLNIDPRDPLRNRRPQQTPDVTEVTQRPRSRTRITITEAIATNVAESTTLANYDYQYEYALGEYDDLLTTTENVVGLVSETTFTPATTERDAILSLNIDSENTLTDSSITQINKEDTTSEPITDAPTSKTTINLLSNFQALTTLAPETDLIVDNVVVTKTFEESRPEGVVPGEVTALQEVAAPDLTAEEVVVDNIPVVAAVVTPAPARRVPQLPPRRTRPETSPVAAPEQQDRRPLLTSRFTPKRTGSESTDDSTRRSPFQRPTPRTNNENRDRERQPSRFRPRPSQDRAEESSQADSANTNSAFERNRNRFRNRPTSENRFQLNPVAVTTEAPVTRARRPRPERVNTRPKTQIRFRNNEEITTETVIDITEPMIIENDVALIENESTPNDLFSAIFGNNEGISTTIQPNVIISTTLAPQPVDHRVLEPVDDVIEEKDHRIIDSFDEATERIIVPSSSSAPITESPINFEDFFTPTISRRVSTASTTERPSFTKATRVVTRKPTTPEPIHVTPEIPIITTPASRGTPRPPQTSPAPQTTVLRTSGPRRGGRPKARSSTSRPQSQIADYYDYFYDDEAGALGGTLGELADLTEKALLLPGGKVKCFDTGYFVHPESCKKFISCSKTVRGAVRGWVYTCPQQLVFDPVGGMCNWAEAVDCQAPVI